MNTNQNGKGDAPRNCFSEEYRQNYDLVFRKVKPVIKRKSKKQVSVPVEGDEGRFGKTFIGNSCDVCEPKVKKGYSLWIEWGRWFIAPTVDSKQFGRHSYDDEMATYHGIHDCSCGCYMGSSASSGPVDPFGPCPMNQFKK